MSITRKYPIEKYLKRHVNTTMTKNEHGQPEYSHVDYSAMVRIANAFSDTDEIKKRLTLYLKDQKNYSNEIVEADPYFELKYKDNSINVITVCEPKRLMSISKVVVNKSLNLLLSSDGDFIVGINHF